MSDLLEKFTRRIEALERQQAAIQLVIEAHDAENTRLTALYVEQKAINEEASYAATEHAREIRRAHDRIDALEVAIESMVRATTGFDARMRALESDNKRMAADLERWALERSRT